MNRNNDNLRNNGELRIEIGGGAYVDVDRRDGKVTFSHGPSDDYYSEIELVKIFDATRQFVGAGVLDKRDQQGQNNQNDQNWRGGNNNRRDDNNYRRDDNGLDHTVNDLLNARNNVSIAHNNTFYAQYYDASELSISLELIKHVDELLKESLTTLKHIEDPSPLINAVALNSAITANDVAITATNKATVAINKALQTANATDITTAQNDIGTLLSDINTLLTSLDLPTILA
jgi:hypothetical protein